MINLENLEFDIPLSIAERLGLLLDDFNPNHFHAALVVGAQLIATDHMAHTRAVPIPNPSGDVLPITIPSSSCDLIANAADRLGFNQPDSIPFIAAIGLEELISHDDGVMQFRVPTNLELLNGFKVRLSPDLKPIVYR